MNDKFREFVKKAGLPRLIIAGFLFSLFIVAFYIDADLHRSAIDVLNRFGMNSIMVLAMVPMIQSGCGLNFGLPVGLIAGMLGAVITIQFEWRGIGGILAATAIGIFFGSIFGYFYGKLLNKVKGDEMVIATYVGYSFVAFMNILWIVLPFSNPNLVQGFKGQGLRPTIDLKAYWDKGFSYFGLKDNDNNAFLNMLKIREDLDPIPVGMFVVLAIFALLVFLFFKTKMGSAVTAVGSNADYARAAGVNVDRMRIASVIFSSALGAVGIIVYAQSYGFVQMFNAPLAFAFPSVAAILLGGATVNKAKIVNVLVGCFLFQGLLTMTPTVINSMIKVDISEVLRVIISNGMIIYALTRKGGK